MWTRFMDMHSGGGCKEPPYEYIYIEAPKDKAIVIFYNRFGHSPLRVTCTCCGEDYSIEDNESLEQVTGFERDCFYDTEKMLYVEESGSAYRQHKSLEQYIKQDNILVIKSEDIKPEEKLGAVPKEGYVWI